MKKFILVVLFTLFTTLVVGQTLEEIEWITEEYPPYNYQKDKVIKGIAVDLLIEMWKKAGLKKTTKDIRVWPWNRGVKTIKSIPGTCLFSTTITSERKDIFGWKFVFPIPQISDESGNHLIANKSKKIKFYSVDDLKKYDKKYGVVRGDVGEGLLLESGVNDSKLDKTSSPESLVKKLAAGRIDVVSYGHSTVVAKMKEAGLDPDLFEIVYSFPNKPMGYAFHHSTNPEILKKLQKALDELHKDGTAEKIRRKYVK